MQRREMFLGLAGLLVTPAIVRAGSLMRISPVRIVAQEPIRFVAEITHSPSGIIGTGSLSDLFNMEAVIRDVMRAMPGMPRSHFYDGTISIRLLREDKKIRSIAENMLDTVFGYRL